MTKARKTIWLAALAALTSLAMLVPATSASGALHHIRYCGMSTSSGFQPMTLRPGEVCSFFPVAVHQAIITWEIVRRGTPNSGAVCFGVLQYPPGWPNGRALSPTGQPGNWHCNQWDIADRVGGYGFTPLWRANNGFNAVYGQPVVLNFSNATIRTRPQYSDGYWDTLWYYA